MPTTPYVNVRLGGIDRSKSPWLLDQESWYDALNMHTVRGVLQQYPRQYPRFTLPGLQPITALVSVPTPGKPYTTLYALAGRQIYLIRARASGATGVRELPITFNASSSYQRWASTPLGGELFITNLDNQVHRVNMGTVKTWPGNVPSGAYIEEYFGHLFLGNVKFKGSHFPRRVMWSDLTNIGKWESARGNEADHYDCDQASDYNAILDEVTGVKRLGERLIIYTPNTIYNGTYVGLPRVMRIDSVLTGIGCDFRHGLCSIGRTHFFPSYQYRNFFSYDGQQVSPVGNKITNYFFEDLTKEVELRQATWSFYDPQTKEVGWVYVSKAQNSLRYDKAILMSLETGAWWPISVPNSHSFAPLGNTKIDINDIPAHPPDYYAGKTLPEFVTFIRGAEVNLGLPQGSNCWGDGFGVINYDCNSIGEGLSFSHGCPDPYLLTGDESYGDPLQVKELHDFTMYTLGTDTPPDVNVLVDGIHHDPRFSTYYTPLLGSNFLPGTPVNYEVVPRPSGKFFRYHLSVKWISSILLADFRRSLSIEIPTKVYSKTEFDIAGTDQLKNLEVYPPALGTVTNVLIGSGGGGAVKSNYTPNVYYRAEGGNVYHMKLIPNPKRTDQIYYGSSYGQNLSIKLAQAQDGLLDVPVYIPNIGGDPNGYPEMTAEAQQLLHDALVLSVSKYLNSFDTVIETYLAFYFEVRNDSTHGITLDNWLKGNLTTSAIPANSWYAMVDLSYQNEGEAYFNYAGGGSGAFVAFNRNITAVKNFIALTVKPPVAGVMDGVNLDGSTGGSAAIRYQEDDKTYIASGGGGAYHNAGNLYPGGGGTVTLPAGSSLLTGKSTTGEAGTVSNLPSVNAKAGRPWTTDGQQGAYRFNVAKGVEYGSGGVGGFRNYASDTSRTKGGIGYAKVGWRRNPVTGLLESLGGFPGLNIRKLVDSPASSVYMTTDLGLQVPDSITLHVKGVFEQNTYTGGTPHANGKFYTGGTPTLSNRLVLLLQSNLGGVWYLNHAASPVNGCVEVDYYVAFPNPNPPVTSYTLYATIPADGKIYEPTDPNGVALNYQRYTSKHEAQVCRLFFECITGTQGVAGWIFNGFVPSIYAKGAEK